MSRPSLVEFVVLDLEPRDAKRHAAAKQRGGRDAWSLADATVARRADFGSNDRTFTTLTHLAAVLRVGDYVWGYCVEASPLGTDLPPDESARLPEVVLVKKSYSERRRRESGLRRRRTWRLRHLEKENETGCCAAATSTPTTTTPSTKPSSRSSRRTPQCASRSRYTETRRRSR